MADATAAFEAYDYARALERTESFFWNFCDDYVELVKNRAYDNDGLDPAGAASARAALSLSLSAVQRLLAPFLPFVTDEVWSWWHDGSIHATPWPAAAELGPKVDESDSAYAAAIEVLGAIRRAKTEGKRSMRWPVTSVSVVADQAFLDAVAAAAGDIRSAGGVSELSGSVGDRSVTVILAETDGSTLRS